MMNVQNYSLAEIVTLRPEAAALFEKYNMDFCCKGKQKLQDVLGENTSLLSEVTEKLGKIFERTDPQAVDFNTMSLSAVIDHIVTVHHGYVKENMFQILQHIEKVATKHGENYPYMKEVFKLFSEVVRDFDQHMMKEEIILFPRIKALEEGKNAGQVQAIQAPIDVMEYEHENAGRLMEEIRTLTNNYTAPPNACMTFRVSMEELKMFESDLHLHVHLENHILFPRAIQLQRRGQTTDGDSCSCSLN